MAKPDAFIIWKRCTLAPGDVTSFVTNIHCFSRLSFVCAKSVAETQVRSLSALASFCVINTQERHR